MRLIVLSLLFILTLSFTKTENTTYQVSGNVYQTYQYRGGAAYNNEPQLTPIRDFYLYVVSLKDENTKPTLVNYMKVNSDGSFSVNLKPGKYGFVLPIDTCCLSNGQFLPSELNEGDIMESFSSYWEISDSKPVEIIDKNVSGIQLINYKITSCGICP